MLYFYKDGSKCSLTYDSSNRLLSAMGCEYTYNAENTRICSVQHGTETQYVYNTVAKLSQLLVKITNGVVTKYVYGLGLIGEETGGSFKTYHFDYRGSTVALTNTSGSVTDTFMYDTYGKLTWHNGSSSVIFLYNGRDGVITDENGLYYMRARYYSPDLKRFVNADIVRGAITDSTSLNRYAYVNGNPISGVDPLGLEGIDSRGLGTSKVYPWTNQSIYPWTNSNSNPYPWVNPSQPPVDEVPFELSKEIGGTKNTDKDFWDDVKSFFVDNFGFVSVCESEYEKFALDNFYWGYKNGNDIEKSISGEQKPIQLYGELTFDESGVNLGGGFKVNIDDSSGFKLGFNNNEITLEIANDDDYFELVFGNMKAGFTVGQDADWQDYSIGEYHHYYIRPANIAGTIAVAYFTGGAVLPFAYKILEHSFAY